MSLKDEAANMVQHLRDLITAVEDSPETKIICLVAADDGVATQIVWQCSEREFLQICESAVFSRRFERLAKFHGLLNTGMTQ